MAGRGLRRKACPDVLEAVRFCEILAEVLAKGCVKSMGQRQPVAGLSRAGMAKPSFKKTLKAWGGVGWRGSGKTVNHTVTWLTYHQGGRLDPLGDTAQPPQGHQDTRAALIVAEKQG